jgi:hypothetical protein
VPSVRLGHIHPRASHPGSGSLLTSRSRRAHIASMVRFFLKHPELARARKRRSPQTGQLAGCELDDSPR